MVYRCGANTFVGNGGNCSTHSGDYAKASQNVGGQYDKLIRAIKSTSDKVATLHAPEEAGSYGTLLQTKINEKLNGEDSSGGIKKQFTDLVEKLNSEKETIVGELDTASSDHGTHYSEYSDWLAAQRAEEGNN